MTIMTEYPAHRHANQTEAVLRLILDRGSLTHEECEEATAGKLCGKITTIRSRIPEIKTKWGWPVRSTPESHGQGSHARYSIDFKTMEGWSGIAEKDLHQAIASALSMGLTVNYCWEFIKFARNFRRPIPRGPIEPDLFNDPFGKEALRQEQVNKIEEEFL